MIRLWYVIFCILYQSVLSAETLFIKSSGSSLSKEEHDIVYHIMLETQFPMSLVHGTYSDDEIGEMNKKIHQKLPSSGISAQFIPTTLYELFVLKFINDNCKKDFVTNVDLLAIATDGILSIKSESFNNEKCFILNNPSTGSYVKDYDAGKSIANIAKSFNENKNVQTWHNTLNTYITTQIREKNIDFNGYSAITNAIDFWKPKIYLMDTLCETDLDKELCKKAIACDIDAFKKNQFVLYRGTTVLDFNAFGKIGIDITRSISFGETLFAGIIFDIGACAYWFITNGPTLTGYALFIDKHAYAKGSLANLFDIPPFTTLASLVNSGNLFHARSKVAEGSVHMAKIRIKAENPAHARALYSAMLQYIKENHRVIQEPKEIRKPDPLLDNEDLLEIQSIIKNDNKKLYPRIEELLQPMLNDRESDAPLAVITRDIITYHRKELYPIAREVMNMLKQRYPDIAFLISLILAFHAIELYDLVQQFIQENTNPQEMIPIVGSILLEPDHVLRPNLIKKLEDTGTLNDWDGMLSAMHYPALYPRLRQSFASKNLSTLNPAEQLRISNFIANILISKIKDLYDLVESVVKSYDSIDGLSKIARMIRSIPIPELQPLLEIINQRLKTFSQTPLTWHSIVTSEHILTALNQPPLYLQCTLKEKYSDLSSH